MRTPLLYLLFITSTLPLAACGINIKEELGLNRRSPDEFLVITRAPLELPPGYTLPVPTPGAPRPQEKAATTQAAEHLIGTEIAQPAAPSGAEAVILQKTQAADPDIRATLEAEKGTITDKNTPTIKRLFDFGGAGEKDPATLVDPVAERARIEAAKKSGAPLTGTGTATFND